MDTIWWEAAQSTDISMLEDKMKKLQKGKYDLDDFLTQMKQIKKLGPLENLIKLIPGAKKMGLNMILRLYMGIQILS